MGLMVYANAWPHPVARVLAHTMRHCGIEKGREGAHTHWVDHDGGADGGLLEDPRAELKAIIVVVVGRLELGDIRFENDGMEVMRRRECVTNLLEECAIALIGKHKHAAYAIVKCSLRGAHRANRARARAAWV